MTRDKVSSSSCVCVCACVCVCVCVCVYLKEDRGRRPGTKAARQGHQASLSHPLGRFSEKSV